MIDGKVVAVWLDSCSIKCNFCDATPQQLANPLFIFHNDPERLSKLCASILHFGLRIFDSLCKIGFKQDVKVYKVFKRNRRHYALYQRRREAIIAAFKARGRAIFQPKPGGQGSSNDGNCHLC